MKAAELDSKERALEDRIRILEDIEEIKKLQYIYGYYLDNKMGDQIIDLFSDDTESVEIGGVYLGKEGVKRVFKRFGGGPIPGEMQLHTMEQPVIDVDPDGKTAKGRWRIIWSRAQEIEGEFKALWAQGLYENEYIKENGKWKFKKLVLWTIYRTPYEDGWVKTPVVPSARNAMELPEDIRPDKPYTGPKPYPSTDFLPFHYKHPITGK
jgi:hypothetical protein